MEQVPARYIIQVLSGTEEAVKEAIFQRRETFWLQEYIFDVFVPMCDVVSVRMGWVKVRRRKNIFPGYVLVKMIITNESWYIVRNTPNVTGFLGSGNIPNPLSEEEFETIKNMVGENQEKFQVKYKVGDIAVVTKGPFSWNEWVIVGINEKKGIVKLHINLLGRDVPVELDFWQIKVK